MRSADVVAAVHRLYPPTRYATFTELVTVATGDGPARRLDVWILDTWPSGRFERITVEVKVSRADYLNEVRNPRKRRDGMLLSNRFYFATPAGLVSTEELPLDCGLLEVDDDGHISRTADAPWRDSGPPTWSFLSVLAERAMHPLEHRRFGLQTEVLRTEQTLSRLRAELDVVTRKRENARASQ